MQHDISALTSAAESLAALIVAGIRTKKESAAKVFAGLLFSDGFTFKALADHFKEIPAEFLDLDTEEGQALSALLKQKLGAHADATNIDEILGLALVSVPRIKDGIEGLRTSPSWETKAVYIGEFAQILGRLVDLIRPPVATILASE